MKHKLFVAITTNMHPDLSPHELATHGFGEIYHQVIPEHAFCGQPDMSILHPSRDSLLRLLAHGLLFDHDHHRDNSRSEWWVESEFEVQTL